MDKCPHIENFKVSVESGVMNIEVDFTTKISLEDALKAIVNSRKLRRGDAISLDFILAGLSQDLTNTVVKTAIEWLSGIEHISGDTTGASIASKGVVNSEDLIQRLGDGVE